MSEHTKEPWVESTGSWDGEEFWTIEDGAGTVICMEPTRFAAYESGAFISPEGHRPNAARIVACVNACADINPAAVPAMVEALVPIRDHPAATDTIRERCVSALQLAGATP